MRGRLTVVVLALLLPAAVLAGAETAPSLQVRLLIEGPQADEVPIVVEAIDDEGRVHQVESRGPGRLEVHPSNAPPWTLRAEAAGYWGPPRIVETPGEVTLALWPVVRLQGRLQTPEGSEAPEGVSVRLRRHHIAGYGELDATALCPLDPEGRLDCHLPSLEGLDLRLRVPGFASRFFWDLDLSASDVHDLGTVSLRPGASVVGEIRIPAGYDLEPVRVRLVPAHAAPTTTPADERIREQATVETRVDERGFFSLEGLSAGSYRLQVLHPSLAELAWEPVRVVDGSQTEVTQPLVLTEPVPLRLVLDPPFDPHGEAWQLELYRGLSSGQMVRVAEGEEGRTTAGTLEVVTAPGRYEVRISDSHGVLLATEEVVSGEPGAPHVISIAPIFVTGEVTLGDEPLLARVTFRGEDTWTMDSDLDGRFSGYLPRPGEWDVGVEAIAPPVEWRTRALEVEVDDGDDRAILRLRLPDTTLRGSVVDADGTSVPNAEVTVTDPLQTDRPVSVFSDEDGEFEVRGLDEGPVQAQAVLIADSGDERSSRPETAQLFEDDTAEIRLVLRPHALLSGRVVASDGNPVPRAWMEVQPFDEAGVLDAPSARPLSTDTAGRFEVSLPRSIQLVHVAVLAPGHPLTTFTARLEDVGDVTLAASSGTLAVNLPGKVESVPWADPTKQRPALLTPGGMRFPLGFLAGWAGRQDYPWSPADGEVVVPLLAPGAYAVCWFSPRDWLLRMAPGEGCVSGEVQDGTLLRLSLGSARMSG